MSSPLQKVIHLAAVTNELMRRTQESDLQKQAADKNLQGLAKTAAKALADNDRIEASQIEKVASTIAGNHEEALKTLAQLAVHRNSAELSVGQTMKVASDEQPRSRSWASDAPVTNYNDTVEGRRFRDSMLGSR